jgi:hypothetical protein
MGEGTLTETWRSKLLKRMGREELICYRCGERVEIGCEIRSYTRAGTPRHHMRLYHRKCFEELFLVLG